MSQNNNSNQVKTPEFITKNSWSAEDFKQILQTLEKLIQDEDPEIKINKFGNIEKFFENRTYSIKIDSWGATGSRYTHYNDQRWKALVIKYSKHDTKRVYAKNPNVLFNEVSKIVKSINEDIQYSLKRELKQHHSIRLDERKKQEWIEFSEQLGFKPYLEQTANFENMTISRHDKIEITPSKINFSISGITTAQLKSIMESLKN